RKHILAFDQDESSKTKQRVNAAIFQFGRLLTRTKGQVKIALWNGEDGKGIDDLIVNCGANAFHEAIKDAPLFEQWLVRQYSALSYPPALELNQRYLEGFTVPSDAEVVGIKAPKGTGKTEAIKRIVDRASQERRKVLVLVHRVQLVQSICDRVGLRSIYELLNSREAKDKEQSSAISVEMDCMGYGLCIDSLHPNSQAKFNADDWDGAILIIDECEQVFKHLFNSTTCKDDRISILQTLAALVQRIVYTGGQIILSDADLSDVSIDFVKGLSGCNIKPWIVTNNWKPQQPWQVTPYDSKEAWLLGIEAAIKAGDRVLVTVDSQKVRGRYSSYALETLWTKNFPDKKILRIDSETLELKSHPAFGCIGSGLDEVLKQYDIVVCSPSIETGVSIDLKGHFSSVWGSFSGSVPVDSASQALARLREPVPRHIYVAPRGLHMIGRGETSVAALLKSENQLIKSKLHELQDAANDG
ncbi:MAG TPA: plasmid replication protein, CyRepA1 family, partial [Allocoleopsis sp.]